MRTQMAGSKPTNVLPALLRARSPGNSLGALRLREDHKTSCPSGAQPPDSQWQKSVVPHRREIEAPCLLPVPGSGRSIRPIARAAPRHSGANGRPPSREDRAIRGRREIFPGPPVSDKKEAAVPTQRCPRWQCCVAKRWPRALPCEIRVSLRLTTSIARAATSEFPPAEDIYR
ncbi:MAG: hypothetical protein Udaeo_06100 [Candidatus Udaeobacter sp.]|nr:MAG: hypothetical protein Udaeo_06100 [Candidatus Udaeobacter sp.]